MRRLGPRISRRCFSHRAILSNNLIQIRGGTFYREHPSSLSGLSSSNPPLFPNLTFEIPATPQDDTTGPVRTTGHWAIIGARDTSTFLDILRGNLLCIPPNARLFPYLSSSAITTKDIRLRLPSNAIQYVGFNTGSKSGAGGIQGAYLSARYESRREATDWSVLQHLRGETELNPSDQQDLGKKIPDRDLLDRIVRDLRLSKLLDMPVSSLSNGQTRRCRIAKALLNRPECLLLDEPFMGLDPPTLVTLSPMLKSLAYKSDPLLILGLRPQDPVPDWITDLVVLGKNHSVAISGKKEEVLEALTRFAQEWEEGGISNRDGVSEQARSLREKLGKPLIGVGDTLTEKGVIPYSVQPAQDKNNAAAASITSLTPTPTRSLGEPLIELQSITLRYGTKTVLGHGSSGLTLSIHRNTRLALLGPNGSGKTTLLSLLTSDHPQSYSLPIKFFGRTRLPSPGVPGLSLWEIQRRTGHSSPEVHTFYPKQHSIRRVLESAWAETYWSRPQLDDDANLLIDHVLRYWTPELRRDGGPATRPPATDTTDDLSWASNRETHRLSLLPFGTQRLLLLLRALIKSPDIVILDEAFSGLNPATRDKALAFLEHGDPSGGGGGGGPNHFPGLRDTQALIVVSHVREEVPPCVDEWVRLPSEEEATETRKGVLSGKVADLGGGDGEGLRGKRGWAEVWGM